MYVKNNSIWPWFKGNNRTRQIMIMLPLMVVGVTDGFLTWIKSPNMGYIILAMLIKTVS